MKYYSTKNKYESFSFRHAVIKGLADDGGLYMPEFIPLIPEINNLINYNISELSFEILKNYTDEDLSKNDLASFCEDAFSFDAPLKQLDNHKYILELFHGPTLAFKDFGARFMARVMGFFAKSLKNELNILVATSGDTGSAVASGFHNVEGINVYILYPSNKVSKLQEKQLTTYGENITALEIEGTFDDCQTLVKKAFQDSELNKCMNLTSANSINIARLLPQTIYYFYAYKQLINRNLPLYFTIPSGNLGNLTAGLLAKKMGLPITKFISALNINKVFHDYLATGNYEPRESNSTISNAMDVGNPSNLERINYLFNDNLVEINSEICSSYFDDKLTGECVRNIFQKYNYLVDPHGAVGILAEEENLKEINGAYNSIILETAHPAKFKDIIEKLINTKIELPNRLKNIISKEKYSIKLNSKYENLKSFLLLHK